MLELVILQRRYTIHYYFVVFVGENTAIIVGEAYLSRAESAFIQSLWDFSGRPEAI